MSSAWITDTIPSLPLEPPKKPQVDLGGFVFTAGGIAHPITSTSREDLILSVFAPEDQVVSIAENLGMGNGI